MTNFVRESLSITEFNISDTLFNAFDLTINVLVIQANISQPEGDWQSAMQFCGSPLGSRNPLNTSTDISVNVSSSGEINRLSWIAAYAFYTSWIKMLGLCWNRVCLSLIKRVKPITLPVFHSNNRSKWFFPKFLI